MRHRWVRPGCAVSTLLRNLTTDAHGGDGLLFSPVRRLGGIQDEGLEMGLPALERV